MRVCWTARVAAILAILVCGRAVAFAQDVRPAPAVRPPVVDETQFARIRSALATTPVVETSKMSTFYARVEAERPTFADYMKRWDLRITPTVAPGQTAGGGGGLDLLQLWRWALQTHRDREARQIRARIDRELAALPATASVQPLDAAADPPTHE
jgi:hypothetical protein